MRYKKCLLKIFSAVEKLSMDEICNAIPEWGNDMHQAGYNDKEYIEIIETIIDYKTHTP